MVKITFMGAGSSVFAKNILGDYMLSEPLQDAHIALYDVNADRFKESWMMLENLNGNINKGRATITAHLGKRGRRAALKGQYPELIAEFNIPLDEYPRRCIRQIERWKTQSKDLVHNKKLTHKRTHEYGSYIMEAMETDVPFRIGGNVLNDGLIPNTAAELPLDQIRKMCDDLIGAHEMADYFKKGKEFRVPKMWGI